MFVENQQFFTQKNQWLKNSLTCYGFSRTTNSIVINNLLNICQRSIDCLKMSQMSQNVWNVSECLECLQIPEMSLYFELIYLSGGQNREGWSYLHFFSIFLFLSVFFSFLFWRFRWSFFVNSFFKFTSLQPIPGSVS